LTDINLCSRDIPRDSVFASISKVFFYQFKCASFVIACSLDIEQTVSAYSDVKFGATVAQLHARNDGLAIQVKPLCHYHIHLNVGLHSRHWHPFTARLLPNPIPNFKQGVSDLWGDYISLIQTLFQSMTMLK